MLCLCLSLLSFPSTFNNFEWTDLAHILLNLFLNILFLDATIKGSDFLISFCNYSLILYRSTNDFYMLIFLYAEIVLNSLTNSYSVFGKLLEIVSEHDHCACE